MMIDEKWSKRRAIPPKIIIKKNQKLIEIKFQNIAYASSWNSPWPDLRLIPILPDEIAEQVLVKLPAKSVIRFSSVNKTWLRCVSSPCFRAKYESFHSNIPRLVLSDELGGCSLFTVSLLNSCFHNLDTPIFLHNKMDPRYWQPLVLASAKGLVMLGLPQSSNLSLWNPSTNRHFEIPYTYDQYYGLGYSSKLNDYFLLIRNDFAKHYTTYSITQGITIQTEAFAYIRKTIYEAEALYADTRDFNYIVQFDYDLNSFTKVSRTHVHPSLHLRDVIKLDLGYRLLFCNHISAQIWKLDTFNDSAPNLVCIKELPFDVYGSVLGLGNDRSIISLSPDGVLHLTKDENPYDIIPLFQPPRPRNLRNLIIPSMKCFKFCESLKCFNFCESFVHLPFQRQLKSVDLLERSSKWVDRKLFSVDLLERSSNKWVDHNFCAERVSSWVTTDLHNTTLWLQTQPLQSSNLEIGKKAAEYIMMCLEKAVKLVGDVQLQLSMKEWQVIPTLVKELADFQARKYSSTNIIYLRQRISSSMTIYETRLQELTNDGKRSVFLTQLREDEPRKLERRKFEGETSICEETLFSGLR